MPIEGPAIEHAADKRAEQFDEVMNRTDAEREAVMLQREKDNLMTPIKKQMVHEVNKIRKHGDKKNYINKKQTFSSGPNARHKSWNKDWIGENEYLDGQPIQDYAETFYNKHKGKSIYDLEEIGEKVFDYNKQDFVMLKSDQKGPETGGRRRRRRKSRRKSRRKRRKSRRKSRRKNKSRKRRRRTRRRRR